MDQKKSWQDIERSVSQSRLALYQLSSFTPTNFTFYKNLLIFLGVPPDGEVYTNENTLIYVDVENGCVREVAEKELESGGDVHSYLFILFYLLFSLVSLFLTCQCCVLICEVCNI